MPGIYMLREWRIQLVLAAQVFYYFAVGGEGYAAGSHGHVGMGIGINGSAPLLGR